MITPNDNCKTRRVEYYKQIFDMVLYFDLRREKQFTIQETNDSIMINESIWLSMMEIQNGEDNPLE